MTTVTIPTRHDTVENPQTRSLLPIFVHDPSIANRALSAVAVGYWAAFWLMNGLDKFLNRTDLGAISWYGKDRTEQFGEYFSRLDVTPAAIEPVLRFAGLWEIAISIPLIFVTVAFLWRPSFKAIKPMMLWGYVLSGLTLIAFSLFDVVAGDRAELREHGLYLALLFVCCQWTFLQLAEFDRLQTRRSRRRS